MTDRFDYGPYTAKLSTDRKARKEQPMATGFLDYFPDAAAEVANVSFVGNQQHNPGQPTHWAKEKSGDHADCIMRHLTERGTRDTDGMRHTAKLAWRALALLQTEIEDERKAAADNSRVDDTKYPPPYVPDTTDPIDRIVLDLRAWGKPLPKREKLF
jgi:hypothetical protein